MRGSLKSRLATCTLTAALLGFAPALAQEVAVESPARLRVTTTSEEAARHFWTGIGDARNIFFSRAIMHFDRAIALDGELGLARVARAVFAPGLTSDQRKAEVDRGLAAMTSATTGELVTALAFREFVAGNTRQTHMLFKTASKMLPGDPALAFYAAQTTTGVEGPLRGREALREVTEKFPDDAATYNILAYTSWQTGDRPAALAAVKRYVELAPDHPNPHDSYAELLQWDRRFSEALAHYGRAIALDSSYTEAYIGTAEVLQLMGRGAEARRQIEAAITRAPSTPTRINYMRAVAHSFLLDGRLKEGMDRLAAAARDAQADNRDGIAAQAHRQMALADATLGRGSAIAAHLKAAAEIGGVDAPEQLATVAVAHGTAGDLPTARKAAEQLATAAQTRTQFAGASHAANAVILLRENKAKEALAELAGVEGDDPLVRALRAECHRAMGNVAEARTLRDQVLGNPEYSLIDLYQTLARMRAARVKV
ncbi:MAG: hypothetical protein ACREMJ_01965 [Gemmatimonadales bacterium]